jgi:hypothetical protein
MTIAVVAAVIALLVTACIPNAATGDWTLTAGSVKSNTTGVGPPMFVLGDSLIFASGPNDSDDVQAYADNVRFFSGHNSTVAAAGGASWSHFTKSSLIGGTGLSTAYDYINFLKPRLTVIALGTNDARILNLEAGQQYGYTYDDFVGSMNGIVSAARATSKCVLLVNVTERPETGAGFVDKAKLVNLALSTQTFDKPYVRLADWNAQSINHPEWFRTEPIFGFYHHTDSGKAAYRQFIMNNIVSTLATPLCA